PPPPPAPPLDAGQFAGPAIALPANPARRLHDDAWLHALDERDRGIVITAVVRKFRDVASKVGVGLHEHGHGLGLDVAAQERAAIARADAKHHRSVIDSLEAVRRRRMPALDVAVA